MLYALRRCKAFGLRQDDLLDGVLWVTPFAIVCTRAYYCIFYWDLYRDNPISCLYIWDGGLAIYGGIIGAAIGILVFSRVRKLPVGTILDITSLGFLIGQAMGRWGNFFNREAHGYETDSFLRMGLTDTAGNVAYYHPTFLYESCWNLLGFVLLHFYSKRRKYDGQIATMYLAWYGFGRMFIEGLRTDSLYLPGTSIRVSQLPAAVTFVGRRPFSLSKPSSASMMHRSCSSTGKSRRPRQTRVRLEADILSATPPLIGIFYRKFTIFAFPHRESVL